MVERHALPVDGLTRGATGARRRLVIDLLVAYVAAWLAGVGFGAALRGTSAWKGGFAWEVEVLRWFHAHQVSGLPDRIMLLAPFTGTNLTILPLMLVLCPWLWKKKGQPLVAIQLLVVSVGSLSLNPTMKYLLNRDRPALFPLRGIYNWASYPSGHAILTIALYFTVALLLRRRWGWRWPFAVAAGVLALNCASRLYLAVHWPTDLIGGLLIGLTWLWLTWRAFARYRDATGQPLRVPSRA